MQKTTQFEDKIKAQVKFFDSHINKSKENIKLFDNRIIRFQKELARLEEYLTSKPKPLTNPERLRVEKIKTIIENKIDGFTEAKSKSQKDIEVYEERKKSLITKYPSTRKGLQPLNKANLEKLQKPLSASHSQEFDIPRSDSSNTILPTDISSIPRSDSSNTILLESANNTPNVAPKSMLGKGFIDLSNEPALPQQQEQEQFEHPTSTSNLSSTGKYRKRDYVMRVITAPIRVISRLKKTQNKIGR